MAATSRYQKQKTPKGMFAMFFILLCAAGYYLSGLFKLEGVGIMDLGESLAFILSHPFRNWTNARTPACIGAGVCAWFAFVSYYLVYYRNFQYAIEHGSEDWGDAGKTTEELEDKEEGNNRILSKNLKVSLESGLSNNNMLVIGSSGSFKTTGLMHPNILQMASTYVVLDVKGDTQRKLGKAFIKAGYQIRSLNLKTPAKSDQYNPFVYIETEDDLVRLVKGLQDSVRPPQNISAADPFWDDGVRLYLQAVFYYEWLDARENGRTGNMNGLLRLINMENQHVDKETTRLQVLMDEKAAVYGEDYPPVRDYRKLKEGAPDTVRSIVIMVNAMLSLCETAEIRRIFEGNDINIRELGTGVGGNPAKKTILFLIIPDNNNAYNFLISMFYTQMFDILIRLSDDELHAPLPCRVEVWMDEFYAGAKPQEPDVLLGVVRSRNISMIPILQSIAQIKTLYQNDKWETIMDNVATVVYLGSGPLAEGTHKYISEALGKATIDTRNDTLHRGRNGNSGMNFNRGGRELMTPAEVKRMPRTECIIFLEGRAPVYDQKSIPFDVPEEKYDADGKMKKRYAEALGLGAYEHPVEVFYDAKRLRYYTMPREQVLSFPDEEEAGRLRETAKDNKHIRVYDIDEKELLYFNFGTQEKSMEEIEKLIQEAVEKEKRQKEYLEANLLVMKGMGQDGGTGQDGQEGEKAGWEKHATLAECLDAYFGRLSPVGQEIISFAVDDGLPEECIKELLFIPEGQMGKAYRQYKENVPESGTDERGRQ